jgi:hypothetical protein
MATRRWSRALQPLCIDGQFAPAAQELAQTSEVLRYGGILFLNSVCCSSFVINYCATALNFFTNRIFFEFNGLQATFPINVNCHEMLHLRPGCRENQLLQHVAPRRRHLGMRFDSLAQALPVEAASRNLRPANSRFWGELMTVVVATNTLHPVGGGKTFVFNLRGAAPGSTGHAGAAAM